MKFLVPNYSCLQNPWLGGYRPPDPRSLCPLSSTEFVEPPLNKIPGYATDCGNAHIQFCMFKPQTAWQFSQWQTVIFRSYAPLRCQIFLIFDPPSSKKCFFLVRLGTALNTECLGLGFFPAYLHLINKLPTRYTLCERRSVFSHALFLSSAMEFKTLVFK